MKLSISSILIQKCKFLEEMKSYENVLTQKNQSGRVSINLASIEIENQIIDIVNSLPPKKLTTLKPHIPTSLWNMIETLVAERNLKTQSL